MRRSQRQDPVPAAAAAQGGGGAGGGQHHRLCGGAEPLHRRRRHRRRIHLGQRRRAPSPPSRTNHCPAAPAGKLNVSCVQASSCSHADPAMQWQCRGGAVHSGGGRRSAGYGRAGHKVQADAFAPTRLEALTGRVTAAPKDALVPPPPPPPFSSPAPLFMPLGSGNPTTAPDDTTQPHTQCAGRGCGGKGRPGFLLLREARGGGGRGYPGAGCGRFHVNLLHHQHPGRPVRLGQAQGQR